MGSNQKSRPDLTVRTSIRRWAKTFFVKMSQQWRPRSLNTTIQGGQTDRHA